MYSSPLSRAYETAEVVNQHHGKEIFLLDELKEMSLGKLEGRTKDERLKMHPWFDWNNDEHRKKLTIETMSQWEKILKEKIVPMLLEKHVNETIILSTHYFKIQALLLALGIERNIVLQARPKPCALTIIEKDNNKTNIICFLSYKA